MEAETLKLVGEKVFLRIWKPSDIKALNGLACDKSIARFTTVPSPYEEKHAKEFISMSRKKIKNKEEFCFAILSKQTNTLLGSASLTHVDWRNKKAEIGYWLGKPFRKKGFMSEAVQLLLKFAFKRLKLNRVRISCVPKNKASKKVIERAGAKYEGKERKSLISGLGKKHDLLAYSLLAKEWKDKKTG